MSAWSGSDEHLVPIFADESTGHDLAVGPGTLPFVGQPAAWLRKVAQRQVTRAPHGMGRIAAGDAVEHLAAATVKKRRSSLARAVALDDMVFVRAVLRLIEGLPDRQRETLYLRHVVGMTPAEIAERFGIAVATVGVHTFRAIQTVRELWEQNTEAEERWRLRILLEGTAAVEGDEPDRSGRGVKYAAMPVQIWVWCSCWPGPPEYVEPMPADPAGWTLDRATGHWSQQS